jgi:hypothetical protein
MKKQSVPREDRTPDLQIMRLTRYLLRYGDSDKIKIHDNVYELTILFMHILNS